MLEAVKRQKIRDIVAEQLEAYIVDQRFKPGDRLPSETALAAQFGVSRLTVREATKALEFFGLVESKPGVGLTVGRINFRRMTKFLEYDPALWDATTVQLVETRLIIEVGILPHVIRRMREDPTVYDALCKINEQLRQTRDLVHWVERDIALHHLLIESSGLTPLLAINELLTVFFQRFRENVVKADWQKGIESHQRILDALRDGHLEIACDEMTRHVRSHLPQDQRPEA